MLTTSFTCDECKREIADPNAGRVYSVQYIETVDGMLQMDRPIILHFHAECFDWRTALNPTRIDTLRHPDALAAAGNHNGGGL